MQCIRLHIHQFCDFLQGHDNVTYIRGGRCSEAIVNQPKSVNCDGTAQYQ